MQIWYTRTRKTSISKHVEIQRFTTNSDCRVKNTTFSRKTLICYKTQNYPTRKTSRKVQSCWCPHLPHGLISTFKSRAIVSKHTQHSMTKYTSLHTLQIPVKTSMTFEQNKCKCAIQEAAKHWYQNMLRYKNLLPSVIAKWKKNILPKNTEMQTNT